MLNGEECYRPRTEKGGRNARWKRRNTVVHRVVRKTLSERWPRAEGDKGERPMGGGQELSRGGVLGEAHWRKPPTLARHHCNHVWVILWQAVPAKNTELISHHQPEEFGKSQKETHASLHLPESFSLASILAEQCLSHQEGLWVRMIGQRPMESNPITIKPKTGSHVAEQFSWVPVPRCSLPRFSFQ